MPTIGPAVGNMKAISTHPGIIPASTGNNDAFSQLLSDPDIAKDDALAGKSHEKRQSKGDTPTEPITVRPPMFPVLQTSSSNIPQSQLLPIAAFNTDGSDGSDDLSRSNGSKLSDVPVSFKESIKGDLSTISAIPGAGWQTSSEEEAQKSSPREALSAGAISAKQHRSSAASSERSAAYIDEASSGSGLAMTIHVSAIETHLPVAISQAVTDMTANGACVQHESQTSPAMAAQVEKPLRVLRFNIEPQSLGLVTVHIRMSHSRVSVKIGAQTHETCALLKRGSDTLSLAISEKGVALDSLEITRSVEMVPAQLSKANSENEIVTTSGGQAFAGKDQAGDRKRQEREPSGETAPSRHERAVDFLPEGVML